MRTEQVQQFAREHLSGIWRGSGESYYQHGCEIAEVLSEINPDKSLTKVAMLHDLFHHPKGGDLISKSPLNEKEKALARGMHDLRRLRISGEMKDLDRVIDSFTRDGRLLILRLAHRLNDIRHLERFSHSRQKEIAQEAFLFYSSFAARFGFNAWRHEIEDRCFWTLHPEDAAQVSRKMMEYEQIDENCLNLAREYLAKFIAASGIQAHIVGRRKSLYSCYRKMIFKNRKFEDLTDRLAIRIIVDRLDDCYRVLGIVHGYMHPIPGKLKDYIGAPKENGYKSIHTVVYPLPGVNEEPLEIQIRTAEINRHCEYGAAAHYRYKYLNYSAKTGQVRIDLFRSLDILRQEVRSADQFQKLLKTYFRDDRLIIFDQNNNLYHLKRPASVLDFAGQIHKPKFSKIKDALVNGKICPLGQVLKNGDVVQLNFKRDRSISLDWLSGALQNQTKQIIRKLLNKDK